MSSNADYFNSQWHRFVMTLFIFWAEALDLYLLHATLEPLAIPIVNLNVVN